MISKKKEEKRWFEGGRWVWREESGLGREEEEEKKERKEMV